MKTVFLIAGFDIHDSAETEYAVLSGLLEHKSYRVIRVPFTWRQTTLTQYVQKFSEFYAENKSEYNVVLGNSFGAAVAFVVAPIIKPNEIYLCSISPFFKEDDETLRVKSEKYFGKRRMDDFATYSAYKIAAEISDLDIKTTITYGEKEHQTSPKLVARNVAVAHQVKNARLIEVPGAPHDLCDETYAQAIAKML